MTSATGRLVLGIDPGPVQSAYAIVDTDYSVVEAQKIPNEALRAVLRCTIQNATLKQVCVESIQSYGKPVGRETFETCYEIGRLIEICEEWAQGVPHELIPRQEYVNAVCGCKGSDSILRQALLLRFGGDKKSEPLHALKGSTDLRSAYALAVYWMDTQKWRGR